MQSAIEKAKILMKAKKAQSASAKTRTQGESLSRTQDNDTDSSAMELKEFLELESKMQKMSGLNWWSSAQAQSKQKAAAIANAEKFELGSRKPFVGPNRPEQVQNKLRESLQGRMALKGSQVKDNITKSALTEFSKNDAHGSVYQAIDRKNGIVPTYRKRSFLGFTERPSPLIKSKADAVKPQNVRDEVSRRNGRQTEEVLQEKITPKTT